MTPKQIARKLATLRKKQSDIQEQVTVLQTTCPHRNLYYKPKGTSGGWDYGGSYWYEWRCYDCEKRWCTEQSAKESAKYPHAIRVYQYNSTGLKDFP